MKTLLVRTGGLGDCILTLPVLASLRDMYPGAEIHILGNGTMCDIARLAGTGSEFRSLDEAGFSALFAGSGTSPFLRSFFSSFNRVYYFSAGDPEGLARTILDSGAGSCRVLDPRPPRGWCGHIADHLLTILETDLARPAMLPSLSITVPPSRRCDLLFIHPGSGGLAKTWPLERFLTVAGEWRGEVVFFLGPAEIDRGFAERFPGRFETILDPPLPMAATLLAAAKAYLGNDSGASHLAALCGTPSVVLFGPTDPHVWRPLGENVRVIVSANGKMDGIGVEEVVEAIETV